MIVVVIIIDVFVCLQLFFFSLFSYAHQDFRNYAMVQFGVIDLKSNTLSRA